MSCISCSGDNNLAGASLCLIPATQELRDFLAGTLAQHNLLFERRGTMLALVGPRDPACAVELLRYILDESEQSGVTVASIGTSGFPEQHTLDDWWRIQETGWLEQAMANPFGSSDPESRGPAFTIWFQPVIDTSNNRPVAHECLARVHSSTRQNYRQHSAAEIFDAAWLRQSEREVDNRLRQLALQAIADRGGPGAFFINFLPHTIYEPALCLADTFSVLKRSGIAPAKVIFEVVNATENEHNHLRFIADTLREQGCCLSLDDLGVAKGGLELLQYLRPEYVKLSSALLHDIESPLCASAIRRIVEAADRCGSIVIAKNVESARTVENLWLLGVQYMQGHFFGRPAPTPVQPRTDLLNLASALDGATLPDLRLMYRS